MSDKSGLGERVEKSLEGYSEEDLARKCQVLGCPHIARYWYSGKVESVLGMQRPQVRIKICEEHADVLSEGSSEYLKGVSNMILKRFEKIDG